MARITGHDQTEDISAVLRGSAVAGPGLWRQRPIGSDAPGPFGSGDSAGAHSMTGEPRVSLPEPHHVEELFRALSAAGIDAVLIGGIALLRHVHGRNTEDIDLILPAGSLQSLAGFQILDQTTDSARGRFGTIQVDALHLEHPVFGLVARRHADLVWLRRPEPPKHEGVRLRCATPMGLAMLKIYALPNLYRLGRLDRAGLYETDLLALRQQAGVDLRAALEALQVHLGAGDRAELARIVEEVESRARRMADSAGRAAAAGSEGDLDVSA